MWCSRTSIGSSERDAAGFPSLPVDVLSEPGEPLNQQQARLVQDVELNPLMMFAGQEHDYRRRLMSHSSEPMSAQSLDRDTEAELNSSWRTTSLLMMQVSAPESISVATGRRRRAWIKRPRRMKCPSPPQYSQRLA